MESMLSSRERREGRATGSASSESSPAAAAAASASFSRPASSSKGGTNQPPSPPPRYYPASVETSRAAEREEHGSDSNQCMGQTLMGGPTVDDTGLPEPPRSLSPAAMILASSPAGRGGVESISDHGVTAAAAAAAAHGRCRRSR